VSEAAQSGGSEVGGGQPSPASEPRRGGPAWTVADAVFLAAFVMSVVVQLNDPDPWAWVGLYGAAAVVTALSLAGRGAWYAAGAVAAVAVGWAVTLAPRVIGTVPFRDMFGAFEMESVAIEESREMYGLLIIATWMVAVALRRRR
jgi:hypothetical protein